MATSPFTAPSSQKTTVRAVGTFAPDATLGPLEIERRALLSLVSVGTPPEPLPVPAMQLILLRRTFAGSAIGLIDNATLTEGR